ncbi:MAG TPA: hypothetical protein DDZ88_09255 [Verrucomicrobiales bacterium]|nr:hypothetical protein [Verrucomicrobiales bacterium]
MKRHSKVLVLGLSASLVSALAALLFGIFILEDWMGDTQPILGYAFTMIVAVGVFLTGCIITILFAVSKSK